MVIVFKFIRHGTKVRRRVDVVRTEKEPLLRVRVNGALLRNGAKPRGYLKFDGFMRLLRKTMQEVMKSEPVVVEKD